MNLEKRINAFVKLGLFLKQFKSEEINKDFDDLNVIYYDDFFALMQRQKSLNGWFDIDSVKDSIESNAQMLSEDNLKKWLSNYTLNEQQPKHVGVIMAGNIPLVGFHDFLTVLITGNVIKAKLSSNDNTLLPKIAEVLISIEPDFKQRINFIEKLEDFSAVIATGSDNTARYFKQYFDKYPHIIRKNRTSVAIVSNDDTEQELKKLGTDVFKYYGLGCRNVSKLFLPENYKLDKIFEAFYEFKHVIDNNKYANNYDYNKAVYLLGNNKILDNNFLLMKEDQSLNSPVGVLHYEHYSGLNDLKAKLNSDSEKIQCIVSSDKTPCQSFLFGQAQYPELTDYADGVDTVEFITKLA